MNKYVEGYNTNNCLEKDELTRNNNIAVIEEDKLISYKDAFNLFWAVNTNILYVVDDDGCFVGVITNKYLLNQVKRK